MTKVVVGKGISTKAWARDASSDVDDKVVAFAESTGLLDELRERGGWSADEGFIDDAWILLTDADESDLDYDPAVVAYATLPRTEDDDMTKIHHSELTIFDAEDHELTGEDRRKALVDFRLTGTMFGAFFARTGGAHEDPEDPSTWGPETAADVDWTGFDG